MRNVRRGYQEDEASRGMYREGIRLDLQRSRYMTESYKETDGLPMVMRRALAFKNVLTKMDIYIQDWERIVGSSLSSPEGLYFGIDMNWRSVKRIVEGKEGASLLDEDGRRELAEMIEYWKGRSMSDRQQSFFSGDILKHWKYDGTFLWTHWSELGIPNYEKIFKVGLAGLIQEAEGRLAEIDRNVPLDYVDQKEFLQAVIVSLEAMIEFAHRYAELAEKLAAETDDSNSRTRLEEIARVCRRVPEHPPRTLLEALQSFFFVHVGRYLEYSTLGIGVRFDKIFGPYYEQDLRDGLIDRAAALEYLQLLWVKFHELGLVYSPMLSGIYGGVESLQALTIGGVDENELDVTNEMTYLVLETAKTMKTLEPSLALRYHDGAPDKLLSEAVDVIRAGVGYPSFFNDRAIVPTLEAWNVPKKDALDYAITGCVYLEVPGKKRGPPGQWWIYCRQMPVVGLETGAASPHRRTVGRAHPGPPDLHLGRRHSGSLF